MKKTGTLRFQCSKCCDDIQMEPCKLSVPLDGIHGVEDIMVGLTTCPIEGCNYMKGKWVKNGETYQAEWKKV